MRFIFVIVVVAMSSILFSTPAKAQGCAAISAVTNLIPGAFKTVRYFENIRFHMHKRGARTRFKAETLCMTSDILKNLEQSLNLFCPMIESLAAGPSNPLANRIKGKLDSIKGKLGAISGAENRIRNSTQLGSYIDRKMTGINNDTSAIKNMLPKSDMKAVPADMGEDGWIPVSQRDRCKTANPSGQGPSAEEIDMERKSDVLGRAKEAVKDAQYDFDRKTLIRDNAKDSLDNLMSMYDGDPDDYSCAGYDICPQYIMQIMSSNRNYKVAEESLTNAKKVLDDALVAEAKAQREFDAARAQID